MARHPWQARVGEQRRGAGEQCCSTLPGGDGQNQCNGREDLHLHGQRLALKLGIFKRKSSCIDLRKTAFNPQFLSV